MPEIHACAVMSGFCIRPSSHAAILCPMINHRYHLPHYQQVAVYFWPILFFELWRVDLWQNETGRRAFVRPDKYGRAWVPYFEGMSQKPHVNGVYVQAYKPDDVDTLCPGWLDGTLSPPPTPAERCTRLVRVAGV
ncbi:MAG: hypothetical protein AAGL99_09355 [Pseudomonadota bacterium]